MSDKVDAIKRDNKGHKAKVKATAARSTKLDNKLRTPALLDPERLKYENQYKGKMTAGDGSPVPNSNEYVYPIASSFVGHWARPDPRDTYFDIVHKVGNGVENSSAPGAITPWGLQIAPPDLPDWLLEKKQEEENWNQLKLGSYLIDGKKPETQERAYSIFPELKDYPENFHTQNLAVQEALRTMLRDGTIRGKEDNALIYKIIQDDFVLPMWPVWDPQGLILGEITQTDNFWNWQSQGVSRGFFNPKKWKTDPQSGQMAELQRDIKKMILKRLYPGLREKDEKTMDDFIKNMSAVSLTPTKQSYALGQYATPEDKGPLGVYQRKTA